MLQSISMRNIALIKELTIPFSNGLHVLTGETGAGKSIVVDAVNLVLGGRVDKSLIRTGTQKAFVEAVFDISQVQEVSALLSQQGIEAEDNQLIISREINENGKSIARLCGIAVQVAYLKQITALLMDVHGQHEHQYLMDPKRHLAFLDMSGDKAHFDLLIALQDAYERFMSIHRDYAATVKQAKQREQRADILTFQLTELTQARLKPNEDEFLASEKALMKHAHLIGGSIGEAHEALFDTGAVAYVKSAAEALAKISALDDVYTALHQKLESLYYELEDTSQTLSKLNDQGDYDPNRQDKIDERLDLIRRLSKKYKPTVNEMIAFREDLEKELADLQSDESRIELLKEKHRAALKAYRLIAREVTASRKNLAGAFESKMMRELGDLGMEKTTFSVMFAQTAQADKPAMPTPSGDDAVEFQISPNPGEPLKPMTKIASGGELSRIMLAIKTINAKAGGIHCMVFDEIDTGISGKMAQVVAEKMASIARYAQVVCVTHLPQIAAMADRQYLVEKSVVNERTYTNVLLLDAQSRRAQIARMVSGAKGEDASAHNHAQTMLSAADAYKAKMD